MAIASNNEFPSLLIKEGTAPASPAAGDRRLYIDSTSHLPFLKDSGGLLVPLGAGVELGYAQITTASLTTTSASLVDLTGLTVTVTVLSRPILVKLYIAQWSHSVSNSRAGFALVDVTGSATIQLAVVASVTGGSASAVYVEARVNPAAGSRTYKAQFEAIDAGTITSNAGATQPASISVWSL
jgi:hypothetical protein